MKTLSIGMLAGALGATALMLASPAASARDHVSLSLNVGAPGVVYPAYQPYAAPVYSAPPVVYAQPEPVYVNPAPVYYAPPRVYVAPAPVYRPVYYGYYGRRAYWNHGYYGHHGEWHHGR